ncbi:hypothetical protein CHS0354_036099 [Potamilus streckersoni]|uniref:Uncharacterized protein n=1 Tax=Potamilus streckersoni TaxID=2493646 RepID=A0AAE0W533_9BIVA|nr:hypothetical protein CHS0354_036099 [Potamilus streckersoni]
MFLVFYKSYGKSISQSTDDIDRLDAHEMVRRQALSPQEGALVPGSLTKGTELYLTTENVTSISKDKEGELLRAIFWASQNPELPSHNEKAALDLTPDTRHNNDAQHVLGGKKSMDADATSISQHRTTVIRHSDEGLTFDHRTLSPIPLPEYSDAKHQEHSWTPNVESKYSPTMVFPQSLAIQHPNTNEKHTVPSHTDMVGYGPIALPQTQGSESTASKDGPSAGQPENSPKSPTGRQIRLSTGGPGQSPRMSSTGPDGQQNIRPPLHGWQQSQPPKGSQGRPMGQWDQRLPPAHGNQQESPEVLQPNHMSQQDPRNQHGSNRRDPQERSDRPSDRLAQGWDQRGIGSFDGRTNILGSAGGSGIDLAGEALLNSNIGDTIGDHISDGLELMADHQMKMNQEGVSGRGLSWFQGDWSGRDVSRSGLAPRRSSDYPITENGSSSVMTDIIDSGPQRGPITDFHSNQHNTQMSGQFNSRNIPISPYNTESYDRRFPYDQTFTPSNGRDTLYPPNQNFRMRVQYDPQIGIGGYYEKDPRFMCQNPYDPLCMHYQKRGREMDIETGRSEMDIEGDEMDIEGPDAMNLLTSLGMSPNTTNLHALDINIKHNVLKTLRERFNVTSPQDMVKLSADPLLKHFMFSALSRSSIVAPGEYKVNLTAQEIEHLLASNNVSTGPPSPTKTEGNATQALFLSSEKSVPFNEGILQPKAERLVYNPSEENETAEKPEGPVQRANLTNGLGNSEAESNAQEAEHPAITDEKSEAGEDTGTGEKGEAAEATKSVTQEGSVSSDGKSNTEQVISNPNNPDTSDPNIQEASGSGTNSNSRSGTSQSGSGINSGQEQPNQVPTSKERFPAGLTFGIIVAVLIGMGIIIGPILCLLCKWWKEIQKKKRKKAAFKNRDISCNKIYDDMVLNDLGPNIPLTATNEEAYPSGHHKRYSDINTNKPESELLQSCRTDPRGRLP